MPVLARDAVPNVLLYNLRDGAGLSQGELAEGLNDLATDLGKSWSCTTQSVSRWERGVVDRPDPLARRLLAAFFGVSIDELGFTRPRPSRASAEDDGLGPLGRAPARHGIDGRVTRSQEDWQSVRRDLNRRRSTLSQMAARLYEPSVRLADTGVLAKPGWLAPAPVDLASITLDLRTHAPTAQLCGGETQAAPALPLKSLTTRHSRYSAAISDLVRPRLYENRLSYRLLDVDWSDGGSLSFGHTTYFEMVDLCELVAHEMALAHPSEDGRPGGLNPSWRRLDFRKLIGDPFDLRRRPVLPSINTLTIRRSRNGSPSMVLHHRDPASVAVAGGMLHVMPAGAFQPSSVLPTARLADFDLWRNIQREFSEEFLGNPEHGGDGQPIDYAAAEPFIALDAARASGRLRVLCFGLAVDALTLAGEVLTAAVIDDDVYDEVFAEMVQDNDEGTVAATTAPFEEHTVRRLLDPTQHALAPAAAACVRLAWDHRDVVLGDGR